jgi:pilus assembly protein CpaF
VTYNYFIIAVILFVVLATLYYLFKKDYEHHDEYSDDEYSLDYLKNGIKEKINELTDTSHVDLNLSKGAAKKEEARKLQLIRAIRTCGYGDLNAKEFVKDYIKKLLQKEFGITEVTADRVIPFEYADNLSKIDKFDIILYLYKKKYGLDALYHMITENRFNELKGTGSRDDEKHYEITRDDIEGLYHREVESLNFLDKLEIITQRVYAGYLGNGVIDEIRDMRKLDGVSAGLSGLTNEYYNYMEEYMLENRENIGYFYNSIWIMFQGKTIHLSFLGFGSKAEMIRVAKKIYRYDEPGYLSEDRGYIINSMSDGSRIVVVRPKVAENWAFFIRKLNSIENVSIENLITDINAELPIKIMNWFVRGCCTIAVTGKQFSGKTTLLKSLIEFINSVYNVRIQEMIFELRAKEIPRYKNRNFMTLRDTNSIGMQEVMDLFKKMDGDIYIFGEIHSPSACAVVIQGALAGTRQMMFSHHAKTSEALVDSFKVSMLQTGVFSNEMAAEEQVSRAINFDFHMMTSPTGHIYLERITEIIPDKDRPYPDNLRDCFKEYFIRMTNEKRYRTRDIVIYNKTKKEYELVGVPSQYTRDKLSEYLSEVEMKEYDSLFSGFKEEIA